MIKRPGKKPLLLIAGISGVGKSTMVKDSGLSEVISYTSRPIREGEVDGVDYHFQSDNWMKINKAWFCDDYKYFNEAFYASKDGDKESQDCMVIRIEDAYQYAKEGSDVHVIVLAGEPFVERAGRIIEVEEANIATYLNAMRQRGLKYSIINNSQSQNCGWILKGLHKQLEVCEEPVRITALMCPESRLNYTDIEESEEV